jgi:DNA-binding IclR family transcriptional regulator
MEGSGIDNVLMMMAKGRYYSVRDLANLSSQPQTTVAGVVEFLAKYGFVERLGVNDPLFIKSTKITMSPAEAANVLRMLVTPHIISEQ